MDACCQDTTKSTYLKDGSVQIRICECGKKHYEVDAESFVIGVKTT